jgi:type II secretory pathway pseudopilin PulG
VSSSDVTALVVAVVGVAGTLAATVLAQYMARRARQQEIDDQREQRLEAREAERLATAQRDRRAAYVALNAAVRAFRLAMLYHLREGTDQTRAELEQARQAFDLRYAEGQLITTPAVMEAAQSVSAQLGDAYGRIRGLDAAPPETAGVNRDRAALAADLEGGIYQETRNLRLAMRAELGAPEREG